MTEVIDMSGELDRQPLIDEKTGGAASPAKPFAYFAQAPVHVQLTHARDWLLQRKQNVRPWLQFVQTSNFRTPASVPGLTRRLVRNVEYFQSNYLFVCLGLWAYCLLTTPLLLLAVVGSLVIGYKLSRRHADGTSQRVRLLGRTLTPTQQYGVLALCSLPVFYLAGAGAVMFWTLGASCFIISLHAIFYNIDALVVQPEDAFGVMTEEV